MRLVINLQTGQVTQDSNPADDLPNEPSRVPASISKVQFVRAARAADLWDTYKTAIEAHADWPYVTEIPRDDPMVLALASGLGFTDAQLDALWIAGAQL